VLGFGQHVFDQGGLIRQLWLGGQGSGGHRPQDRRSSVPQPPDRTVTVTAGQPPRRVPLRALRLLEGQLGHDHRVDDPPGRLVTRHHVDVQRDGDRLLLEVHTST